MNAVGISLAMLMVVMASGLIIRALPLAIPLPLVQIGLGALIAGVFGHGVLLNPEVFFLLFLPPLLFLDGWRIPKDGLLRDRFSIVQLALHRHIPDELAREMVRKIDLQEARL